MDEEVDPAQLLSEGRYEEFLLQLKRGAERGARIAARRPKWDELVPALLLFREALNETLLEPFSDALTPFVQRPAAPESLFASGAQKRTTGCLDSHHRLVDEQLLSYAGAVSDHLWGLAATMTADPPVRPAFVIGRVLLDAGAHLYYIADPDITPLERSVRAANIRLGALYDELADFVDDEHGAERVEEELAAIFADAEADGVPIIRTRRGATTRCLEPRVPPTGLLASGLLGSLGQDAWRTLSSTVHAQDRPVLELSTGRGVVATTVQGRSQAALHLGASVIMCTEAVGRVIRLRGFDPTFSDQAADNLNNLWMAAAGLKDADIATGLDEVD